MSEKNRKNQHIDLTKDAQIAASLRDKRFNYEPLLSAHPSASSSSGDDLSLEFLGKKMKAPFWISSMTGGGKLAKKINTNLARACGEFGLGMGLGSCRTLLKSDKYFDQFDLRSLVGDQPLYANLGVAQIEKLLEEKALDRVEQLVEKLQADGLIVHVNPLQEFFQPEGDRYKRAPMDTISELVEKVNYKLIVKEVGQGMGPKSLEALIKLPLAAIEFAAFGGTNFSKLESMRNESELVENPLVYVGHSAVEMVEMVNQIVGKLGSSASCVNFILTGGVETFLDGQYLRKKLGYSSIVGQASPLLKFAESSYEDLSRYLTDFLEGLRMADSFLSISDDYKG